MSYWDADRQQWVRGAQPGQTPPGQPPQEPREPTPERSEPPPRPDYEPSDSSSYEPPVFDPGAYEPPAHDATRYDPVYGPTYGPPPGPPGPRQGWSHAAVLTAVVASVVLAAGLGFGGWALLRHHGGNNDGQSGSSSSPYDQSPTDTYGTTDTPSDSYSPTDTPSDSPSDSPSASDRSTAPPGYVRTVDPAGFTVDVPQGWQRSTEGASVFYRTSDGSSLVQVFALRGPETTPYESLEATEKTVSQNPGYHQVRMEQLGSGSNDAAELEYTYVRNDSTVRHVVVQAFTDPSTIQYALLVAGPDSDWAAHQGIFREVLSSFCTAGHCPSG